MNCNFSPTQQHRLRYNQHLYDTDIDDYDGYDGDKYDINDDIDTALYFPGAPPMSPLLPSSSTRPSPYVSEPVECTYNFCTNTVRCISNESHGGLYPQYPPRLILSPSPRRHSHPHPHHLRRQIHEGMGDYRNYVYGERIVDDRPDSPLNRILTRQPVGPWNLIGAAVTDNPDDSQSRDRSMMVYAQSVDTARDKYNYRVVDSNNVPLDLELKTGWKTDGTKLTIPGQPTSFTLNLYPRFK